MLEGITRKVKDEHPKNAPHLIVVMLDGSGSDVKDEHPLKA